MSFFSEHKFYQIGFYQFSANGHIDRVVIGIKLTERRPLVYAMFSEEGKCLYVGKTIQGFSRPLNYHKNDVMKVVREGIANEVKSRKKVLVYAKDKNLTSDHEGLCLNLIHSFEQALIKKHKPSWNNAIDDSEQAR